MQDPGSGSFSVWIDSFRWLAAASVLITHTGLRMVVPVADLPAPSLTHTAYAFLAGFDHQAVMVFFVLSGLLVGGSVVREVKTTGRFAYGRYIGRRLIRLWIVLLPALALSGACMGLAMASGPASGMVPSDAPASLSVPVLLCNAAFLQTVACPQFAANGALWSLFNEFWYYAVFPAFALGWLARGPATPRAALCGAGALALAGLTACQFTGSAIGPYMLVWGVGVAAASLPRAVITRPRVAAALFLAATLAVRLGVRRTFATNHPLLSAELDLLLALLFGNLLLTLRCCPALRPPPWPTLHGILAGFSFSLYCTHIPVLILYTTVLAGAGWRLGSTDATSWLAVGGGLALTTAAAWLFAQATEAHTDRIRRRLTQAWSGQPLAWP